MPAATAVTTDLTLRRDLQASVVARQMGDEQVALIKRTIAKGATDDELALFLSQCQRTGLDPFERQIYWIKRGGNASTQVSIDGFRVIAERTGEQDGLEIHWCDTDGVWVDVWLKDSPPFAARALVYRRGCSKPFPGIAKFKEYSAGGPMWTKMPANQIAKCAEALALRRAFPTHLSGLYTSDEMGQADKEPTVAVAPIERIQLPAGTFQIVAVSPTTWGADVTFVDEHGAEVMHKTTERQCAALCEQVAQEHIPVTLILQDITRGVNKGKAKLTGVHRYQPGPQRVELPPVDDNAALDAEIADEAF
jgi:phage recombination protein Bet